VSEPSLPGLDDMQKMACQSSGKDLAVAEWYVVHTHPRQEERAIQNLLLWGIELLDLWVKAPRNVGGLEPLFPGYIFAKFDITSMLRNIRFTRGVHSVLSFGGKPAQIPDDVITMCRSRIGQDGYVELTPKFQVNEPVVIQSGAFKGITAVFQKEMPGRQRVSVLLRALTWQARVELDVNQIARLAT
jgi:transcriptional antiterminator RfaH